MDGCCVEKSLVLSNSSPTWSSEAHEPLQEIEFADGLFNLAQKKDHYLREWGL